MAWIESLKQLKVRIKFGVLRRRKKKSNGPYVMGYLWKIKEKEKEDHGPNLFIKKYGLWNCFR